MSLAEVIKSQLTTSIKAKDEVRKGILRVVLGELGTLESRSGKTLSDGEVEKVISKVVQANAETANLTTCQETKLRLMQENEILGEFLPTYASPDQIRMALSSFIADIKAAKSDGQATGVAMKNFKGGRLNCGTVIDGKVVAEVVKELRK